MRCSNTYRNPADRSSKEKELLSTQYLLPYANSALSCQLLLSPTVYAVSSYVCKLCSLLVSSSESISTVSTMMHGEYGIEDVCLSTLTLVGPNGIQGKVPMRMNKKEIEQLHKSADALKAVIAQIDLD